MAIHIPYSYYNEVIIYGSTCFASSSSSFSSSTLYFFLCKKEWRMRIVCKYQTMRRSSAAVFCCLFFCCYFRPNQRSPMMFIYIHTYIPVYILMGINELKNENREEILFFVDCHKKGTQLREHDTVHCEYWHILLEVKKF